MVRVTASSVLTMPTSSIGPTPNCDIFTWVTAVAFSVPFATVPVTSHVTGRCFWATFSTPTSWKW